MVTTKEFDVTGLAGNEGNKRHGDNETTRQRDYETTRLRDTEDTEGDCIMGETAIEGPRRPRRARVGVTVGIA